MTPDDCAGQLRQADPDRFAAVMAAEPRDRPRLATLFAANLEIARAAVMSKEPLISEMRLQWWADQLAAIGCGRDPDQHPVATPLAQSWGVDIVPLTDLIEARRHDALRQPFDDAAEVIAHVDGCTGTVMRLAARACGLEGAEDLLRDQARGAGLAGWLGAYPQLRALNLGLFGDPPEALAGLASVGLGAFDSARRAAKVPRRAAPALFAGAGARRRLEAARRGERIEIPEFSRNLAYLALSFRGRWQG